MRNHSKDNRRRKAIKKFFAVLLFVGLGMIAAPNANLNYAGGGNGGGYGKADVNDKSTYLAGSGNGGGYGKLEETNGSTMLAGTEGGGYGKLDGDNKNSIA